MQLLTFVFEGVTFGLDIKLVKSIETKLNVTKVPGSPAHVSGITNLHGSVIVVYSLASRFGYTTSDIGNMIIVDLDGMKVGLEVEQVKSLLEVEDSRIVPMPRMVTAEKNVFNDVVESDENLVVMLDLAALIPRAEQEEMRFCLAG